MEVLKNIMIGVAAVVGSSVLLVIGSVIAIVVLSVILLFAWKIVCAAGLVILFVILIIDEIFLSGAIFGLLLWEV